MSEKQPREEETRSPAALAALPQAEAYLFDIDGTLLNSRDGVHYNAFHAAAREAFGINANIDGVPVHGNTDIGILRALARQAGLPDAEFSARLPAALEIMCAEARRNGGQMQPALCPSVVELLSELRRRGRILGVVSGNLEPIGWLKLEAAGVRQFFDFGSFSGKRELREDIFRHGLEQARQCAGREVRVCFVGDTPADIQAAKRLGCPIISVATGIYKPEDLLALAPDAFVTCCTELLAGLP